MKGPRTTRRGRRTRRWSRNRRGQVSAIATLFGLLIVISLISELGIAPLPTEEQNAELQHLLLVEDQMGELQSDILLEVSSPSIRPALTDPVALGSAPIPPFGPATGSSLTLLPSGAGARVSAQTVRAGPVSGTGSLCSSPDGSLSTSSGTTTCSFTANGCSSSQDWNISLTSATYVFSLKGNSGSCQIINVTGDDNTLTVLQDANDMGSFDFTLYGSHNTLIVEWQGKTSGAVYFNLYGSNNTYEYGSSGTFDGNTVTITTNFYGETEPEATNGCPYENLASTDKVGALKTTGTSDTQSLFFYNSIGTTNGPHSVTPSGDPALTWENFSETATSTHCAFGGTGPTGFYSSIFEGSGSLSLGLQNHDIGSETLSLEGGAVIVGQPASGSVLAEPPPFNFTTTANGNVANLTLINFVETSARTASGYSTAAIVTELISETVLQTSVPISVAGQAVLETPVLNITTAYPGAWLSYFDALPATFLNGTIGCSSTTSIASPYTCESPPTGQYVSLSIPLDVKELRITEAFILISVV